MINMLRHRLAPVAVAIVLLTMATGIVLAAEAPLYEITGTATLNWQPPTENVDGTPLTDLAGYKIFWSTSAGEPYEFELDVNAAGAANWSWSFPMNEPTPVDWFFAMQAYDADGNHSAFSNEVKKSVVVVVTDNRPPAAPILESVDLLLDCQSAVDGVTCAVTVQ